MRHRYVTEPWEWTIQPAVVYNVSTGESEQGWRCRYRAIGTRWWTTFLILGLDEVDPALVCDAIERHAYQGRPAH